MSQICKNCNSEITLNFCANCGQKKAKRIDANYVKDELQYVLVHTNKGFFYSIKKIVKSPGRTAFEFIDGNRVNHYKPILMVFLLAGISAFLNNTFIDPVRMLKASYAGTEYENMDQLINFFGLSMKYNSLIMLCNVPMMAIFTWIAFKSWGYNYYENVIANAYLLSASLIFSIVIVFPVQLLFLDNPKMWMIVAGSVVNLAWLAISVWFYIDFYAEKSAVKVIGRLALMYLTMGVLFFIFAVASVLFLALSR